MAVQSDLLLSGHGSRRDAFEIDRECSAFLRGTVFCCFVTESVSVFQDGPGHPGILGGYRDCRALVTAALDQVSHPTTESILLFAQVRHYRASSENQ
jgi:hypothetical protein